MKSAEAPTQVSTLLDPRQSDVWRWAGREAYQVGGAAANASGTRLSSGMKSVGKRIVD